MNKTLDRNDLIAKMNLGAVPSDLQDQIIAQLGENVLKAVMIEVTSQLAENDQAEFDTLIKKNDPKLLEKFLLEKIPNFDDLIKEKMNVQIEAVKKAMAV